MNKIINLTQHDVTPEMILDDVVEPFDKARVQHLLTFDDVPNAIHMEMHAHELVRIAEDADCKIALIGGAPFFMAPLEKALKMAGIKPIYAFSKRVSSEVVQPDGSVVKTNVFKCVGYVGL